MEKIQFKRTLRKVGDSKMITLPSEICDYLGADESTELLIMPEKGKHGNFISIWNQIQQEKKEE